jgi:starch synthase
VISLTKAIDCVPDIIHCNDWQTALVPVYLRTVPDLRNDSTLSAVRILYTIHNLAYQGLFDPPTAGQIGIGSNLFHPAGLEFYGKLNLMKGGIIFADAISTVSKRYAQEIQTKDYGSGLDGVLRERAQVLTGILNGIDYGTWNPETDPHIAQNYSAADLTGKARCQAALQEECGLPVRSEVPLIGIISRLDPQKGFDLIGEVVEELLAGDIQLVLLGTGVPEYHGLFEKVAAAFPKKASINLRFDNALAHRIEAGCDMFLMPSRYEPCGLNQLYSLKYGTIPIVRRTGGLADSIRDATPQALAKRTATGFVFEEYTSTELMKTVRRALALYARKAEWRELMVTAMEQDFSWSRSASEYVELFKRMTGDRAV